VTVASALTAPPTVAAPPLITPQQVGALPGRGGVSPDGAYTYTIPIETPEGRAGMEPKLALNYNSRGGNGMFGMGWTLSGGASYISRCPKTWAAGRKSERVTFTTEDRFCLDGQRLLLVSSGTYGAAGTEYRTEMDSFAKVVLEATESGTNEPIQFRVSYKDGRIGVFSRRTPVIDKVVYAPSGAVTSSSEVTLRWPLTTLYDRSGNGMTYTYAVPVNSVPNLTRIDYTLCLQGPCAYPSSRLRRVEISYEARGSDASYGFMAGAFIENTQRVSQISTYVANAAGTFERVHRYMFRYVQSAISGRNLLKGVKLCDGEATPVCLPETVFSWQGESPADFTSASSALRLRYNLVRLQPEDKRRQLMPENAFALFDVNSDGNDDVVLKSWASSTLDMSNQNQAAADRVLLADGHDYFGNETLVDPRGDGSLKNGCNGSEVMDPATAQPIDLDGDGRKEWVVPLNAGCPFVDADTGSGTNFTRVQPGTSGGITPVGTGGRFYGTLAWDRARGRLTKVNMPPSGGGGGWDGISWSNEEVKLADMNGDGLPDFLWGPVSLTNQVWQVRWAAGVARSPALEPQVNYFSVFTVPMKAEPSRGNGLFLPTTFRVLDEDGDGRAELLQTDNAGSRRSFYFSADQSQLFYRFRRVAATELANETSTSPFFGTAAPTWGEPNFTPGCCTNAPGYWYPVDVNGDGLKDMLYASSGAVGAVWHRRLNTGAGYGPPLVLTSGVAATLNSYPKDTIFTASPAFTARGRDTGLRIVDMNGDGREDLVLLDPLTESATHSVHASGYHTASGRMRVAYSNGNDWNAPVAIDAGGPAFPRLFRRHEGFMTQFGDINGDGLPEIVDMVATTDPTKRELVVWRRQIAPGGTDVIVRVSDERGTAGQIQYDNMSAGTAKRLGEISPDTHVSDLVSGGAPCSYPARCTSKGTVVRRYEDLRAPRTLHNAYTYQGARADAAGRGWLGFRRTEEKDLVTNFVTIRSYDLTPIQGSPSGDSGPGYHLYPKASTPTLTTVTYVHSGSPATDLAFPDNAPTTSSSTTLTFTGYPVRLQRRATTLDVYRGALGSNLSRTSSVATDYDTFGNEFNRHSIARTVDGSVNADNTTTITTTYDNLTANWLIGLPRRVFTFSRTKSDAYGTGCSGTDAAPCVTSATTTDYEQYPTGQLRKIIREPSASAASGLKLTTELVRDGAGLVTAVNHIPSEAGAVTRTERTVFDESGVNFIEQSNAFGYKTWYYYQPKTRWLYGVTDENGPSDKLDVLVTHDRIGRVRRMDGADGASEVIGFGVGSERRAVGGGATIATFFDPRGRPVIEAWSTFNPGTSAVAENVYNSLGSIAAVRYVATNADVNNIGTEAQARALLTSPIQRRAATYDALGRVRTATNGTNEVSTIDYPAPLGTVSHRDPSGNVSRTFTAHDGRVRSLRQTLATATGSRDLVTSYGYDDRGRLTLVRTPDAAREVYSYDILGRLLERRQHAAAGGNNILNRRFTYTSFDEVSGAYHGGTGTGTTAISIKRDALGRVTERRDANAATGAEVQRFFWDPVGARGLPASSTVVGPNNAYASTTRYTYDSLARLSERFESTTDASGQEQLSFGYTYDTRGRLDTVRYPETGTADRYTHPATGGLTIKYGYQNGQLSTIRDLSRPAAEAPLWAVNQREAYGAIKQAVFTGDSSVSNEWRRDPNTTRLSMRLATVGGVSLPQSFVYHPNGLLSRRFTRDTVREDYTYDALDRLRTYERRNTANISTQRIAATFSYDDVGNMTGVDTTASQGSPDWPNIDESYQFSATLPNFVSSHVVGTTTTSFVPDAMGRILHETVGGATDREYLYSVSDLPTRITLPPAGRTVKLAYNARNERTRKTSVDASGTSDVLYVGSLYEQRKKTTATGAVTGASVFRIAGEDGILAEINHPWTASAAGTRTRTQLVNDHQGSPAFSVTGSTITTEGYLPFGKKAGAPLASLPPASVGYTGHIHDDDLGLVNMRGRVYDVSLRRFISRDPVMDNRFHAGGLNPYAYALGNPVNRRDPTGYGTECPTDAGGRGDAGRSDGGNPSQGGDRSSPDINYGASDAGSAGRGSMDAGPEVGPDGHGREGPTGGDAGLRTLGEGQAAIDGPSQGDEVYINEEGVAIFLNMYEVVIDAEKGTSTPTAPTQDPAGVTWSSGPGAGGEGGAPSEGPSDSRSVRAPGPYRDVNTPFNVGRGYEPPGLTWYQPADEQWGNPDVIDVLDWAGEMWDDKFPDGPRLQIGDISREGGGPFKPPHSSHTEGEDVDARPVDSRGEVATKWNSPTYSQDMTRDAINTILQAAADYGLTVPFVFFNDPVLVKEGLVTPAPGHDDHFHVRFKVP
jgi:RHS repeat-associated protein